MVVIKLDGRPEWTGRLKVSQPHDANDGALETRVTAFCYADTAWLICNLVSRNRGQ